MKLDNGVLKNIEKSEVSKILKVTKNIPFFKEYFRVKINEILQNKSTKKIITKKDFSIIKKSLLGWANSIDNYILEFTNNLNNKTVLFLLGLCKNYNDLEKLLFNKTLQYILTNTEEQRLNSIIHLLKITNTDDFIKYFTNRAIIELLFSETDLGEFYKITNFRKFFDNKSFEFFKLSNLSIYDNLFNTKSYGSNVMLKIIIELKKNPKANLIDILDNLVEKEFLLLTKSLNKINNEERINNGKRINNFQLYNMPKEYNKLIKEMGIDINKHELLIYIRYGNTVDYPEIAETIVLFLKKYIKSGYSKYFSSIRIIPIENDKTISGFMFDNYVKLYNVTGDYFKVAHICSSHLYLSYSSIINPGNTPGIISNGTKVKKGSNIVSKLELEEDKSNLGFEKEATLNSILEEVLNNIIKLENELDKIGYIDFYNTILVLKKVFKETFSKINKLLKKSFT